MDMIFDTYHKKCCHMLMCKNVGLRAQNDCFHQNSFCFPMYVQISAESAGILGCFLRSMAFVFAERGQVVEDVAPVEATPESTPCIQTVI